MKFHPAPRPRANSSSTPEWLPPASPCNHICRLPKPVHQFRPVLTAILKGKVALGSVIYSDGWKGCSGLVDLGYKKHHRVDHGRNQFVKHKAHINGIENFCGLAKMRLAKFRGFESQPAATPPQGM